MSGILIAASRPEECAALRRLFLNMKMKVVGEVCNLQDAIAQAITTQPGLVVIDWDVVQPQSRIALDELRAVCPPSVDMVLLSRLNARQHAATLSGADVFISKRETTDSVLESLRAAAARACH